MSENVKDFKKSVQQTCKMTKCKEKQTKKGNCRPFNVFAKCSKVHECSLFVHIYHCFPDKCNEC